MSTYWIGLLLDKTRDCLMDAQSERAEVKGENPRAFSELDSAVIDLRAAAKHVDAALATVRGEEIVE